MDDDYNGLAKRVGWCKKETSADKKKGLTWKQATLVKRYFISDGYRVDYYDKAPVKDGNRAKDGSKARSRGVFDLREVEVLSMPDDATAPEWCVMVQVEKHRFVLDFGYKGERNAWLRIWCNAVPLHAISKEWRSEFIDEVMKKEIATRGPFGQIGSRGSIFGRRLSRTLNRSSSSFGKKEGPEAPAEQPVADTVAAAAYGEPKVAGAAAAEVSEKKRAAEAERAKLLEQAAEKERAAVKLQATIRGKKARGEVAEKRKEALESAEMAAKEAERVHLLERAAAEAEAEAKRLEEEAETSDAATKMQAAMRGKQARKKAREAREAANDQKEKAAAADRKATADAAALLAAEEAADQIKREEARALELAAEAEEVAQQAAAIKLQATVRGRNARNEVGKKRQESADAKAAAEAAKRNTANLAAQQQAAADELAEAEKAAISVQSGIRGRAARKKVEEARKKKQKAEEATEKARREQEEKEKLAAQKAAEAKAAEEEAAAAAKFEADAQREAQSMIQRQKEQAAAATLQSANRGRSTRKNLKEQAAATKLAAAEATEAESAAAAATREVAAAHAELKKRGSSQFLENALADAEEKKVQLDALGSAKACIAKAEQARLDAMRAAHAPDGDKEFDCYGQLVVTLCKCFAPPPPMDPAKAAEEANLINSQGLQFNARGDSRAALRCFLKAASLCPLQSRYLLSAGNMHVKLREAQAARCIYEWLLTLPLADKEASVAQSKLEEAIAMQNE